MEQQIPRGAWAEPKPTDWVAGAESAIIYAPRVENWTPYLPTEERQRNDLFDSNMCVTYAGLNVLETQLVYLMKNNLLPATHLTFLQNENYLDANGRPNFNEVFCAKLNGTTIAGNHLGAFWEGVRKYGVIPQGDWLDIATATTWDSLMEAIPESRLAKGRRFLDMVQINYEWVLLGAVRPEVLEYQSHHAPLHIVSPVCPTWNSGVVATCDLTRLQHATMLHGSVKSVRHDDFDHYAPYEKTLAWDYYIPYAIKGVIAPKVPPPAIPKPVHTFAKNIRMGERSQEVAALQTVLRYLGYFKYPIVTGYYGRVTADAVRALQYQYQLASPEVLASINGESVGPVTRRKLNELLA